MASNTTYFLIKFGTVKAEDTAQDVLDLVQELFIAEHFKWTLEYVRELSIDDIQVIRGLFEGRGQTKDE